MTIYLNTIYGRDGQQDRRTYTALRNRPRLCIVSHPISCRR